MDAIPAGSPAPLVAPGARLTPSLERELVDMVDDGQEVLVRVYAGWNMATTAAAKLGRKFRRRRLGVHVFTRVLAPGGPYGVWAVRETEAQHG